MLFMKRFAVIAFAWIASLPTVTMAKDLVVALPDVRPWAFQPEGATEVDGAGVAMAKELIKRTGMPGKTLVVPFARVSAALQDGEADIAFMLWNDTHQSYSRKGALLTSLEFGILPKAGLSIGTYDDLAKLTIATVRGIQIEPRFDNDAALKRDEGANYDVAIKKVVAGRNDAVAGSLESLRENIASLSLQKEFGQPLVLRRNDIVVHYGIRADAFASQKDLDLLIDAMRGDGTIDRIMGRYYK